MSIRNSMMGCVLFAVIAAFMLMPEAGFGKGDLRFAGCGISKNAFMTELTSAYKKKTGKSIVVGGGGATKGIRLVSNGSVQLGGTCRYKLDISLEKGVRLNHVAWDALVVIVNKNNPVNNITREQLKDVLIGKITNWKELGGEDASIRLLVRKGKISGVGLTLRQILFNDPKQDFTKTALIRKSSGPIEEGVESDKLAIGVSGISSSKKRMGLKALNLDNIAPTKENIRTGKYTMFRPLYLVTEDNPSPEARKFLNFALSEEGQKIISQQGTVNLAEGSSLNPKWTLSPL